MNDSISKAKSPPNIILIMTDQQRFDMLSINGGQSKSPALERLVDGGINFTNAYTPCSLCSPARASLFTGRYPHRHRMMNNCDMFHAMTEELPESEILLGDYLQEKGYDRGYVGKWHVGKRSTPMDKGFEGFSCPGYGSPSGGNFHKEYQTYLDDNNLKPPRFAPVVPVGGGKFAGYLEGDIEATIDYFIIEKSLELLKKFHRNGNPFFLTLQFWGPHEQAIPTKHYYDMYPPEDVELWGSFHDDLHGRPLQYARFLKELNSQYFGAHENSAERWKKINASYIAYNTMIEEQTVRFLDALDDLNLNDTVTIYSSDHGNSAGMRGGFCQKAMTMFEDLYHIPLVVNWPGVTRTETRTQLVSNMDVFSTVLDLIDADSRNDVDGRSLVPLLSSSDVPWRESFMAQRHGAFYLHSQRMLRWKNFKYVFTPYSIDELYDLERDPYELENRIDDEELAPIRLELRRRLLKEIENSDDPIFTAAKGYLSA